MTPPRDMAIVLLAAGRSSRFGGDKLAAPLDGKPLIHHAAGVLAQIGFPIALVVAAETTPDLAAFGFAAVAAADSGAPMSASIARGVEAAAALGAGSVLIALADMPFVPAAHYRAMIEAFAGNADPIGSLVGDVLQPPALFARSHFARLTALRGDAGARTLLAGGKSIALEEKMAADVDTHRDLERIAQVRALAQGLPAIGNCA